MSYVFEPFPEGHRNIGRVFEGLVIEHPAVLHFDAERVSAVQAGKIYGNLFAGEQPADRQRFKASLAEPFLLAVYGDPVVGGQIVKGRERYDVVGLRVQPAGNSG